ncbi:HAMP domain-containing sensor histidine kinase [Cohnella lubricantis]|uniref:histidine kinase n=1 Tax=Cohnella lubricantis TaxID=2163172 RepID=A0A841TK66_9BACL|nr:HAMP domain-containing sensor histidine kinase [Cohnella lubricantis]MBB6679327.1 HAMP domain-containing histidine kinase [Cohnella lubricantis]MBP2120118.1 signal transduction histidine kinase [Cohnella lubricantis]
MKQKRRRLSLRNSLLTKYFLIVLSAMLILPIGFPAILVVMTLQAHGGDRLADGVYNSSALEKMWHAEAAKLADASPESVDEALRRLKEQYPKAAMFWVDQTGATRLKLPQTLELPSEWSVPYTIQFMKEASSGSGNYSVVAFLGDQPETGSFMTLQIPRSEMPKAGSPFNARSTAILYSSLLAVLGLFLFISLLFFYRIRKRLVRLETAMTTPAETGIPSPVAAQRLDEIGRLEHAFNDMIAKLERSREREAQEEALRRDLIAKLSHDLRTPLTAIRGHAFGLQQEALSEKGRESLALIDRKIDSLGRLIDNLFSFTLLASGQYPYKPQRVDIVRMARTQLAGWYPAFEQEGFEIDSDLPEEAVYWEVDTQWLERVLDNYLQNVLRHAKSGRCVALRVFAEAGGRIVVADRGPGMNAESMEKGAGIGLSIAALMLKDMKLRSVVRSGPLGTEVHISRL